MDYLIERKATGKPKKFAEKNRLGRSSVMNVIKEMKEMGFDIGYDKERETYFYNKKSGEAKQIIKLLQVEGAEILTKEQLANTFGGDIHNLCFSETTVFEKCKA